MDKYQKFGLFSGQVIMGLLFGFAGVVISALLWALYVELAGNHTSDLGKSILNSLYGGYAGMQIGIGFDGYKYLKEKGNLKDFKRFFGQSTIGFTLGLLIFYHYLSLFSFFLPMIGAIIGFDLGLIKNINNKERSNIQ